MGEVKAKTSIPVVGSKHVIPRNNPERGKKQAATGVLTTLPGVGTAWNFWILGVSYGCLVLAIGEISSKLCCLGADQVLEEP